jgi:obg family GTPase cgtA, C-terminal extension
VGLGDRFLRHIERCKAIIHIVDISGIDGRDPKEDFLKINEELKNYSKKLSQKKQIVVANKIDMLYEDEKYDEFEKFVKENGAEFVYPISVIANDGIKPVLSKAWELIQAIPREPLEEVESVEDLLSEINQKDDWEIKQTGENAFEVDGRIVDDVLKKYVFIGEEGIISFLQKMRSLGMETELEKAGVKEGDTILIAGYEFEYVI